MCRREQFTYSWSLVLVLKAPLFDCLSLVELRINEITFAPNAPLAVRSDILARFSLLGSAELRPVVGHQGSLFKNFAAAAQSSPSSARSR